MVLDPQMDPGNFIIIIIIFPFYTADWRRKWQPTPVFLPGECHGQKSLLGYSPWDHKELDTTEQLTHTHSRYFKYFHSYQIYFSHSIHQF